MSYEATAPAAINTLMLGRGRMAKDVYPPECLSPAEREEFLAKLAETGYNKLTQVVETHLF